MDRIAVYQRRYCYRHNDCQQKEKALCQITECRIKEVGRLNSSEPADSDLYEAYRYIEKYGIEKITLVIT